jgi:predicted phage terminase large subunit-like protein
MIPWFYDPGRQEDAEGNKIKTSIGWSDWRNEEGEPAWPERFSEQAINRIKAEGGPYMWASQFQQSPAPRGGGILKRLWWQLYAPANGRYPPFEMTWASLDCAASEKTSADYSALTVWGLHRGEKGDPRIMLCDAWAKRLPIAGDTPPRLEHETPLLSDTEQIKRRKTSMWARRCMDKFGLLEMVTYSCTRFGCSVLLIENASNGLAVAQELRRLYRYEPWSVQLIKPVGDKISRAHAVVPLFVNNVVYAPEKDWSEPVLIQCETFPKSKNDDLVDTVTMSLNWARANGLLQTPSEVKRDELEASMWRPGKYKQKSLYPC